MADCRVAGRALAAFVTLGAPVQPDDGTPVLSITAQASLWQRAAGSRRRAAGDTTRRPARRQR